MGELIDYSLGESCAVVLVVLEENCRGEDSMMSCISNSSLWFGFLFCLTNSIIQGSLGVGKNLICSKNLKIIDGPLACWIIHLEFCEMLATDSCDRQVKIFKFTF